MLYVCYIIQVNSFQAVLTTDGKRSFVLFTYDKISKGRGHASTYYAQVSETMCQFITEYSNVPRKIYVALVWMFLNRETATSEN